MADQHPFDERELKLATSRQLPASNGIDPAIKASRQAWLAAGAAAEDLGRTGLNEQALLASLQNELITTTPATDEAGARTFDWSWLALGVAATVLIAATIYGALGQRPEPIPAFPGPSQLVKPSPPQPQPVEIEQTPSTPPQVVQATATSWNDLDEEINTTYAALQQLTNERRSVDQTLTDFDTQLKQLSADIAGESL